MFSNYEERLSFRPYGIVQLSVFDRCVSAKRMESPCPGGWFSVNLTRWNTFYNSFLKINQKPFILVNLSAIRSKKYKFNDHTDIQYLGSFFEKRLFQVNVIAIPSQSYGNSKLELLQFQAGGSYTAIPSWSYTLYTAIPSLFATAFPRQETPVARKITEVTVGIEATLAIVRKPIYSPKGNTEPSRETATP